MIETGDIINSVILKLRLRHRTQHKHQKLG